MNSIKEDMGSFSAEKLSMEKQDFSDMKADRTEETLQKILSDIDAIANKLELIDNSFSDYVYSDPVYPEVNLDAVLDRLDTLNQDIKNDVTDLPDIPNALKKMNMNFYTVVQHLNRITDKIILLEEKLDAIRKMSVSSGESARVSKPDTELRDMWNASLSSLKTDLEQRLDKLEEHTARNRGLIIGIIISIFLNIVLIAMQFI